MAEHSEEKVEGVALEEPTTPGDAEVAVDSAPSTSLEGGVSSAVLGNGEEEGEKVLSNGEREGEKVLTNDEKEGEKVLSNGGEQGSTPGAPMEMVTLNSSAEDVGGAIGGSGSVAVHSSATLQEPCVQFIVKDVTRTDWQKSRYSYSLSQSSAVVDLYEAIAKEAGYQEDSFLLAWDTEDKHNPDIATPLAPKSTQTLFEMDMPTEPKKCYLFLQDGPNGPPVKVSPGEGVSSAGVEPASSISTATSSPAVNNASNNNPAPSASNTTSWSSTTTHYSNKSETGFVGLVNQAMTCYLNSLLQTLYMTPEFRKALYSWKFKGDIGEGMKSIPYQLQRLFIHLQTSKKRAVETTGVTKSFGWDSSEAWQQHDVQELCRVMFDALEKRLRKDDHEQPELINELYQGDLKDYVKCLECDNESAREDHFLDIPLVIKPFGADKAYSSVEEALNGFVAPETLSGDNQYYCDRCKKKCDAHKGLKFTRFPYLLTLQLKRFDFDYSTMHRIKLNDRMTFPNVLNLNKFVDESDKPQSEVTEEELRSLYKGFVIEKYESRHHPTILNSDDHSSREGSGSSTVSGDKLVEMLKEGPYVYELFSIMIHSGSAIGGHYYAYIKSLSDKQWYSFNDQSVSRISRDDIEQTFGGSDRSRGYYSSVYASSANAYMLMYRRVDKKENETFSAIDDLPQHVTLQIREEEQQELRERERQEWEKNLCKFRVFMRHPKSNELVEKKIEVHKDKSLREATQEAHKALGLTRLVPLECCRLVKFDEYTETLDQSFDATQEDATFGSHVGGARSYYSFELFLEIRAEGEEFEVYNKGGLNLKVLVIDLPQETVREPVQFRAEQGWTLLQLKQALAQRLGLDASVMTVALETYQNEGKHLNSDAQTLKSEGFYRKHTVFVCCDAEDVTREFDKSIMNKVIDRHANTITLFVTVPPPPASPKLNPDGSLKHQTTPTPTEGFEDNFVNSNGASTVTETQRNHQNAADQDRDLAAEDSGEGGVATEGNVSEAERGVAAGGPEEGGVAAEEAGGASGGVAAGDTDKVDDSTGVGLSEEEGVATGGGVAADGGVAAASGVQSSEGSTENGSSSEAAEKTPTVNMEDTNRPLQRTVTIQIDRRKTLGDLKTQLEGIVLVPAMEFKIYRVYSNNQEYEVFRLQDSLQSVPNETRMIVRLGRALLPGEFRIKLSLLRINEPEYFKSIMDSIVAKGMTVRQLKERLVKEAYEQGIEFPLAVDRMRLRKKTWRSPGTVYLDHQIFEKDIHVFANYEMFIEPLEGEDPMKYATQMQIYVRRWRPSSFTVDKTCEIILDENTPDHLKQRLSEFSGIPLHRVLFAKAFGSFPCEMSRLDLENDLEWNPPVSTIISSPLAIYDDGAVLYFKDAEESVAELSPEKKAELQKQENSRLSKYNNMSGTTTTTFNRHRTEKALKIYSEDDDDVTSTQETVS